MRNLLQSFQPASRRARVRRKAGHGIHVGFDGQRNPEFKPLRQIRNEVEIAFDQRVMALNDENIGRDVSPISSRIDQVSRRRFSWGKYGSVLLLM